MWFRNLLCYRLTQPLQLDLDAFETALRTKLARKPESQELTTLGFIPPFSKEPEAPVLHQVNGYLLVALKGHERILPGSVVRDAVTEKVEEIEGKDNRKVYKKERDRIKDEIVQALLPQAFVKKSVTFAAFDLQNSIVYVNASSPRKAEDLLSTVREVIGSLPVRPVSVKIAPTATFTDWVKAEEAATDFYVLSDCSLADTDEDGGGIEVKNQDLTSEEIKNLLNSGKLVTEISLAWQDKCSFVVNDKLQIKRLRFEDLLQEKAQQDGGEDAAGQFDASFLLMMSTLAELLPNLFTALGGEEIPQGI